MKRRPPPEGQLVVINGAGSGILPQRAQDALIAVAPRRG